MDPWYLVFGAFAIALGVFAYRQAASQAQRREHWSLKDDEPQRKLAIPWGDLGGLLLLVGVTLGAVVALQQTMDRVERGTPEMDYQSQPFRGAAPLAHWTAHKQHRERDGCSTSGAFDQCYQTANEETP